MDPGKKVGNETQPHDYLWDRSGEPDAEIQRLEGLLHKYRHDCPTPVFPAIVQKQRWTERLWGGRLFPVLGGIAAVAGLCLATFLLLQRSHSGPIGTAGWDVSQVAGTPRIAGNIVSGQGPAHRLRVGEVLETDTTSRVSLQSDAVGQIEVDPSSRLRLMTMGSSLKRIALDRGTIHAFIWAPPGQFVVDTPSAMTVDLGCVYTLHVDDSGAGTVHTSLGWVGFKLNGREAFIPAGAACATRPKVGPGTPYFDDASQEFRAALARFDFADNTAQQRTADLEIVLARARKNDALTLWHLLSRVDSDQREHVFDKLSQMAPPPEGVTKTGVLRLDQKMLDAWWNELGFDDISVWRHWEREWQGAREQ